MLSATSLKYDRYEMELPGGVSSILSLIIKNLFNICYSPSPDVPHPIDTRPSVNHINEEPGSLLQLFEYSGSIRDR